MDLNTFNFCWCCLKNDAKLVEAGETLLDDGADVRAAWVKCGQIDPTTTIIPIRNCRICSLCLVSLKISHSFSMMCRQSVQKLEEMCKVQEEHDDDVRIIENGHETAVRDAQLKNVRQKLLAEEMQQKQQQQYITTSQLDAASMSIEPLNMLELLYDSDGTGDAPTMSTPTAELKIANVQSLAFPTYSGRERPPLKRRLYRCPICRKNFNFQSVLERHKCKSFMQLNEPSTADTGKHFCAFCPKSFSFPSLLVRHEKQHEKYKCDKCGAGFTRSSTLMTHKITDHPELYQPTTVANLTPQVVATPPTAIKKEHGCHLCGKSFSFLSVLQKHIAQHGKYKCDHCGMGFTRSSWLENHLKDVHQIERSESGSHNEPEARKIHRCHLCEKSFLFHSVLLRHIAMHNKYKCEYCDKGFARRRHLEDHQAEEHHGDGNESTSSGSGRNREHPCPLCGKVFLFRSRLLIHLANHEKYKCPLPHCGVGFTRLKDLDDHMLDLHQIEKPVQTTIDSANASTSKDNGGHACPLCHKKFAFQSVLIRHVAQHDKHKCPHCNLGFTKSNLLDRHVVEAHPEHGSSVVVEGNSHSCHMCDKVFPFPSALKVHLAAHKYKCNYCEQNFTRQSAVDSHVREEHPGEWVEVEVKVENRCEICQKVFEYPSALKLHVAWHNKHKCRYCEASFPRINLLEGHVRDEHPDEWNSVHSESKATNINRCHLCNKVLPYPSALKLHLAWHSKHKCPHDPCANAFPTLMLLDDHVRTEHPEKWEERRPEPKAEYQCDMCDKVFPFPSALKLHLAWHTKYQCISCGQPFPTRILLNGHICEHSKELKTEMDCEASASFAIKQEAPDFDDSGEMMMEH